MNDVDEIDLYGAFTSRVAFFAGLTETEVLGITSGASKAEIKKAYHKVRDFRLRPRTQPSMVPPSSHYFSVNIDCRPLYRTIPTRSQNTSV